MEIYKMPPIFIAMAPAHNEYTYDVPLADYEALEFEVYAPYDPVELDLNVSNIDGDSFQRVIWGTAPAGQWTTVSIPVSEFNPGGHVGHRFNIGEISGDTITYYVDNLRLKGSGGEATPLGWDAEGGSFSYDANGNLTAQSGKFTSIQYDHRNLPTRFDLESGAHLMAAYNAGGQRILKESSGGSWQFYVKDGPQTLAVIDQSGLSHFNLIGNDTFGRWEPGGARRYYVKDHLGSTRAVVDTLGNLLETFDYYPFGLLMPKRNTASANTTEKFSGKELDENTGQYYFGARYYDPALGRFFVPDRFAEKYPDLTPYHYTANNPVLFVDVNGDSINVARIREYDQNNGTNNLGTIIGDLQDATGLSLSVSESGQLIFDTDKNGDAIVATDKDGNAIGSAKARDLLTGAISTTKQAFATITSGRSSVPGAGSPLIRLNPDQIDTFIKGASGGLDSRTLGYGMTFMHEMLHSNVGLGASDDKSRFGATGPVVDKMNIIRSQLGPSFGQRKSYMGLQVGNSGYLPFDSRSLRRLLYGRTPLPGSKYIKYKVQ